MDSILANYIQQHKNVDREVHYTHVNCVRPKGRYAFDRQELEGFWKIYCDRFSKNNEMVSGMAEIPQDYSMLVVDGDIKKKISDLIKHHPEMNTEIKDGDNTKIKYRPIRLYNKEHIRNVVKAYQSVIKTVTKDWNPSHSLCILLEKNPYLSDEYVKSGFHLAFVNYFGNKTLQNMHLIPRVVDIVNDLEIFKDIGYSVSSEVLDISKKSNDSKPWLLYGSRKSETSDIYRASSAFLDEGVEISLESAFENYKLYDVFENEIEYKSYDDLVKLFPRVFSINPCFRQTVEIVQGFNHLDNITYNSYSPTNDSDDTKYDQSYEQRMATASKLVELLSASRAENFNEWMEIGWILHSISDGSEAGFHLWDTFSQQSEKYSWEICMDKWGKMYKGNHTIGSLIHYARIDSPEEYEEFRLQRIEKFIKKAINGSHHDLAKALYESYSTEYVCASLKPEMWFEYKNHHWEPMEEGIELRRKISDELVKRYNSIIKKQFDEAVEIDDEDDETKKNSDDRIKALHKLIMNLKCNTFKNSVMKECREVFYDGKFLKRLGKDKYLIALQNGVYDLQNHVFRNGKPEDYIAFQMPIAYREFNEMDPWVIETHNFFEKIFPDTSIRQYFMERLAEMLVGGNKRKHVYFWTGRGNNGKSVAKAFVQKMFGSYFIDIPNSILVGQKPKNGQACPELARADRGVRAAFTQEPNKKDLINTGALKEYSGNDTFYTRTLFEKGGEIEPMFKLVMICLDGNTPIALNGEICVSIDKMKKYSNVLTWDKTNTFKPAKQLAFADQGIKNCIQMTFLDGRTITCTPDHRFLNSSGQWIEAKDCKSVPLKMGISYPIVNDCFDSYDYKFKAGIFNFDMSIHDDRLKAMAFSRILGYQLTDGSLNTHMYMGCKWDCENILNDIQLLTGKRPVITTTDDVFKIHLPIEIRLAFNEISPVQTGGRVNNAMSLPEFIFDDNCPTFIIREFVASLFGGDGILPSINSDGVFQGMLHLVASKVPKHVDSLINVYTKLSDVINKRFNIKTYVSKPTIYGENGNFHVFLSIGNHKDILTFIDTIGIRYCVQKCYRLTGVGMCLRYKYAVIEQNKSIISRVKDLKLTGLTMKDAHIQAISEIDPYDPDLLITYTQLGAYIRNNKIYKHPIINKGLNRFIKLTGISSLVNSVNNSSKYIMNRFDTSIPCFEIPVISIKVVDPKRVYDITVETPYSNFLANGVVSHNCNDLPGVTTNDPAVWNRIRVIPFESTFTDNPPEDEDEQFRTKTFKKDENFDEKLEKMLEPLFWILVKLLPKIKRVIYEPPKVKEATDKYRRSQDIYAQFIDERTIEDDTKRITISDFFEAFRNWHKQSFPNVAVPTRNDCNDYLTDEWGYPVNYGWKGRRLRTERDDILDGRADECESVDYNNMQNPLV